MYVCLCNGLTDKQVKKAIKSKNDTIHCVYKRLGAKVECGKCSCYTNEMINSSKEQTTPTCFQIFQPIKNENPA